VKASRLLAGLEHDQQTKRIAEHFNQDPAKYLEMDFDQEIIPSLNAKTAAQLSDGFSFHKRNLTDFKTDRQAYHHLIADLVELQILSTQLVLKGSPVKKIYVDGGFSQNNIFMRLLALGLPEFEVYAASVAQASALGTALAIHDTWNSKPIPADLIKLNAVYRFPNKPKT
jgi:hypothetical protein